MEYRIINFIIINRFVVHIVIFFVSFFLNFCIVIDCGISYGEPQSDLVIEDNEIKNEEEKLAGMNEVERDKEIEKSNGMSWTKIFLVLGIGILIVGFVIWYIKYGTIEMVSLVEAERDCKNIGLSGENFAQLYEKYSYTIEKMEVTDQWLNYLARRGFTVEAFDETQKKTAIFAVRVVMKSALNESQAILDSEVE